MNPVHSQPSLQSVSEDGENSPRLCRHVMPVELPADAPPDAPRTRECGEDAPHRVRLKNSLADAYVDLCTKHKAIHDERAAGRRNRPSRSARRPIQPEEHKKAS